VTTALFREIAARDPGAFADLDTLYVGGEALDAVSAHAVLVWGPPRRFRNLYGPTETTTLASWHEVTEARADRAVPIGRAVARTDLYLLDEDLVAVPPGEPGEVFVAGAGLGPGYLHRPGLTATRYLPDLRVPGARMYRTGDLARALPDGTLVFSGRRDRQVKIRGFRIELEEVEAVLGGCRGVTACAVEVAAGAGDQQHLVAYVAGAAITEQDVRAYAAARLPTYMVPAFVQVMAQLPVTAGGKVDRRKLAEGRPVVPVGEPAGAGVEERVAAVWARILGVAHVDLDRNFFDVGGTSLLLMQLQAGLRESTGAAAEITDLLAHTTIRAQAALLAGLAPAIAADDGQTGRGRERLRRRRHILISTEGDEHV
jgi:aryl carrier-like protein